MNEQNQAPQPQQAAPALAFSDAVRIARGCTDYGGGHRGKDTYEVYQHGIQTVIAALEAAERRGLEDTQVRALHCMGAATPPHQAPAPQPVGLTNWCYSRNEETYYRADSREEAIAELGPDGGWIAKEASPEEMLSPSGIGSSVFDAVSEALGYEIGEAAECFTLTKDEEAEIGRKVLAWISAGPGFHCFGVKDVERIPAPQATQQEKTR